MRVHHQFLLSQFYFLEKKDKLSSSSSPVKTISIASFSILFKATCWSIPVNGISRLSIKHNNNWRLGLIPSFILILIDFISSKILEEHVSQFHPDNPVPKSQMNEHGKSSERHIPTFISPPRENISHRPAGFVRRQYNCHECDYQGHRSKALFNHSIESGHKKIDSLEETCFTCLQTFDNFIDLMKHRKASHYDFISECHKFKAGGCQFKERCYYRHTATQNPPDIGQDDSFPQGQEEFPPDLKELTLGFQSLMSTFLSNREKQRSRQSGF